MIVGCITVGYMTMTATVTIHDMAGANAKPARSGDRMIKGVALVVVTNIRVAAVILV